MIIVEEWIKETREIRTQHIVETDPCIERGGNSTIHRGVLAEFLDTNLPEKIDLCHYCGNGKCSNPKHLYWGTRKENIEDAKKHGTWASAWDRMVKKYGYEEACKMNSRKMLKNKNGSGNKGKQKSDEHKQNISKSLTKNSK